MPSLELAEVAASCSGCGHVAWRATWTASSSSCPIENDVKGDGQGRVPARRIAPSGKGARERRTGIETVCSRYDDVGSDGFMVLVSVVLLGFVVSVFVRNKITGIRSHWTFSIRVLTKKV